MRCHPPVRCLPQQQETTGTDPANLFFAHPLPLPGELVEHMLSYVGPKGLVAAGAASRLWYDVTSRDNLWQPYLEASAGRTKQHSFKELFLDLLAEKKRRAIRRQNATIQVMNWRCMAACGMRGYRAPLELRPKVEPGIFHPSPAWPVHPNTSNELTVDLGFDVIKSAEVLANFLRTCGENNAFKRPEFLKWALWRYARFMQLKADHADRFLVPTTEIEYVWQSHLLRPEDYARDMQQVLRMPEVIDHRIVGTDGDYLVFDEALRETADLWQRTFGEKYCEIPDEPVREVMPCFRDHALSCTIQEEGNKSLWYEPRDFNSESTVPASVPADWACPFSLSVEDLVKDGEWYGHFVKENGSSYGFYPTAGWYGLAAKAYEHFLYFCHIYEGDEMAHPTYAIDFMWHLHMFHPTLYREGTKRLTGRVLEHIPWPDAHYAEANFTRTNDVWQREFGIPIQEETRKGPWADPRAGPPSADDDLYGF